MSGVRLSDFVGILLASLDQASSAVMPGRSRKRALASLVSRRRPVSAACAAKIRSCAPRGLPDLRTWASSRAWCAAVTVQGS